MTAGNAQATRKRAQSLDNLSAAEQAIATVERWRSFDPLNEDISLRLMQLQFASGNRIAALKTYETYQDVLMAELSAKPSRNLVALAEVLRNAFPQCWPTTRSPEDRQILRFGGIKLWYKLLDEQERAILRDLGGLISILSEFVCCKRQYHLVEAGIKR